MQKLGYKLGYGQFLSIESPCISSCGSAASIVAWRFDRQVLAGRSQVCSQIFFFYQILDFTLVLTKKLKAWFALCYQNLRENEQEILYRIVMRGKSTDKNKACSLFLLIGKKNVNSLLFKRKSPDPSKIKKVFVFNCNHPI